MTISVEFFSVVTGFSLGALIIYPLVPGFLEAQILLEGPILSPLCR